MNSQGSSNLDRGLYLFLSLWMWVIVAAGFWPTYFGPGLAGALDKTAVVHVHVVVYVGWLVLLTVQSALPMLRRARLHRRIGKFGIGYGVLVFVMGVVVSFESFFRAAGEGPVETEARRALLNPLSDMVFFPILFGLAIGYRRKPDLHKRFMVLAATMLLIAAVFRMRFIDPTNPFVVSAVWLSPVWIAMVHDAVFRKRVHPVYLIGAPLMALIPLRNLFVDAAWWRAFADWVFALGA